MACIHWLNLRCQQSLSEAIEIRGVLTITKDLPVIKEKLHKLLAPCIGMIQRFIKKKKKKSTFIDFPVRLIFRNTVSSYLTVEMQQLLTAPRSQAYSLQKLVRNLLLLCLLYATGKRLAEWLSQSRILPAGRKFS